MDTIADAVGTPVYVFREAALRERFREIAGALGTHFDRPVVAWSYKTCWLDAVHRVLHSEGAWAEVVSDLEFAWARRIGAPVDRIIFNGPAKGPDALAEALRGGAMVNLDHADELSTCEAIAEADGERYGVGLRVSMGVDGLPTRLRFGFPEARVLEVARRIEEGTALHLTGLHVHIGTAVFDVSAFEAVAARMARLAIELRTRLGVRLDSVNLGGGLPSSSRWKAGNPGADEPPPSVEAVVGMMARGLAPLAEADLRVRVCIEAGRGLVDDAASMCAAVVARKTGPDGHPAAILDTGVHHLPSSKWHRHRVRLLGAPRSPERPTTLFGCTCLGSDTIAEGVMLPALEVGDRLLIEPIAAYNISQAQQFISPLPPIALVAEDGGWSLLRARQTLDDIAGGSSDAR